MSALQIYFNHSRKVDELLKSFECSNAPLSLKLKGASNTVRSKNYNNGLKKLPIAHFNEVISIDPTAKIAWVESRISFDQLVKETLKYGLMPCVVPEFKGITVGGAIMGAAAESSSFREGIFSDICINYEMLLGNASVKEINKAREESLFCAIGGSYGSLGTLLSVHLKLEKALDFVNVTIHFFDSLSSATQFIKETIRNAQEDFIDGIVFSNTHIKVLTGRKVAKKPASAPLFSIKSASSQWFFEKIKKESSSFYMPIYDYLFRYDKAAFWMGSFLLYMGFASEFFINGILKKDPKAAIKNFYPIKTPGAFSRFFLNPCMESQKLWKLLHKSEEWIQRSFIIQDFCIPFDNALDFLGITCDNIKVYPLWLCPIKSSQTKELFNPHFSPDIKKNNHFLNIGIYGQPIDSVEKGTKLLEEKTIDFQGRKVLYAKSYYSEEEFWNIYSKKDYEFFRAQTYACNKWLDITKKVLSN
jgi:delta24-sterol reductase